MGGRVQAVHIWLHCVPSQSVTETNAWEAHEEWALKRDKRVGWLWRSLSKSLFHTAFISPHSDHPNKWTLQYFASRINRSLEVLMLLSSISMYCVEPLMLVLLVLLQWLAGGVIKGLVFPTSHCLPSSHFSKLYHDKTFPSCFCPIFFLGEFWAAAPFWQVGVGRSAQISFPT